MSKDGFASLSAGMLVRRHRLPHAAGSIQPDRAELRDSHRAPITEPIVPPLRAEKSAKINGAKSEAVRPEAAGPKTDKPAPGGLLSRFRKPTDKLGLSPDRSGEPKNNQSSGPTTGAQPTGATDPAANPASRATLVSGRPLPPSDTPFYQGADRRLGDVSPVIERRRTMPPRIKISVRLESHRYERLKIASDELDRTHQDLMTRALDHYLDSLRIQQVEPHHPRHRP